MPLTPKGSKVMAAMQKEYGAKKGESVFYASANAGKIKGVHHSTAENVQSFEDRVVGQEAPPKTGNPNAAHPASYTNPRSTGYPALALRADGTASPRETVVTHGPTKYETPPIMGNSGPIRNTGKFTPRATKSWGDGNGVDTFGDGTEVELSPSGTRGVEKTPNISNDNV